MPYKTPKGKSRFINTLIKELWEWPVFEPININRYLTINYKNCKKKSKERQWCRVRKKLKWLVEKGFSIKIDRYTVTLNYPHIYILEYEAKKNL